MSKVFFYFFEKKYIYGEGQFIDRGNSYKAAIFYSNDNMKAIALKYIKRIEEKFQKKVMVMLIPEMPFYYA